MKRTLTTTIAALAALAWLPPSTGTAAAQETTAQEALEKLMRAERPDYAPAVRILRQADGPRAAAELDAFADRVAAVAADATLPEDVRWEATGVLAEAASTDRDGTPYPRAFDLLVRAYESGYDHALIRIGRDEFLERGMAYMRELFERSEPPPLCRRYGLVFSSLYPGLPECEGYVDDTPWCKAGGYLFGEVAREAHEANEARVARFMRIAREGGGIIDIVPEEMPEQVEDWYLRCL